MRTIKAEVSLSSQYILPLEIHALPDTTRHIIIREIEYIGMQVREEIFHGFEFSDTLARALQFLHQIIYSIYEI